MMAASLFLLAAVPSLLSVSPCTMIAALNARLAADRVDRLRPEEQLTLKVASVNCRMMATTSSCTFLDCRQRKAGGRRKAAAAPGVSHTTQLCGTEEGMAGLEQQHKQQQ